MEISQLLKDIKYVSDLNQAELANILGCSQVSVSRLRRGIQVPKTDLLVKLIRLANRYKIEVKLEDFLTKE